MKVISNRRIIYRTVDKFSNGEGQMWNPNQSAPPPIIMGGAPSTTVVPKETLTTKAQGTAIKTKKSTFDWKNTIDDIVKIWNKPKQPEVAQIVEEKKAMNTTTKVLIAVGGVALLATVIYLIKKK
jgi:hypothetical protein